VYEWTVKIRIAPAAVADGFNLTQEKLYCALLRGYPYLRGDFLDVEIVATPGDDKIAREMGYPDSNDPVFMKLHGGG
jgi:hypothetical protein